VDTLIILLVLALDAALVIGALLWLSGRRAEADPLDFRKRDRVRRRQEIFNATRPRQRR